MGYPPHPPLSANGHNGQVTFDGQWVTITRQGFLARASVGKGDKRIHISQIPGIQWKPAGPLVNGFISFGMPGAVERRSRSGRQTNDHNRDANSVLFTRQQMADFERIRAAVEQAIAAAHGAPPRAPAPVAADGHGTAAERMRQLDELRTQGLVSDQEYAAKRAEILGSL
jgi:hypothetical protein